MRRRHLLFIIPAILALLWFAGARAQETTSTAGFTITGADHRASVTLGANSQLKPLIENLRPRFQLHSANQLLQVPITKPATELLTLINNLRPRFQLHSANQSLSVALATPPNELSVVTGNLLPRIQLHSANQSLSVALAYPKDLLADRTAPQLSRISAGAITNNSLTITFTSSEYAIGRAEIGTTPGSYSRLISGGEYTTTHRIVINQLSPNVRYYYRITARDRSGNSANSSEFVIGPPATITPTRTRTPTATSTRTRTPTFTPTRVRTPTFTPTRVRTPTFTPTRVRTPTFTPTRVRTPTVTPTRTRTPTVTPTRTRTPTVTPTRTRTPTVTPTPSTLFADDFASNPNLNGRWTIYRHKYDPNSEAVWNASAGNLSLTTATQNIGTAIFASHRLTARSWEARFRYRVTPGDGSAADGFTFMFYKQRPPTDIGVGGTLAFNDHQDQAIPGYGIEFDAFGNTINSYDPSSSSHIALIQNHTSNHLAYAVDRRTEDGNWHDVIVRFNNGTVTVSVDNSPVISYRITNMNYTFTGVGFSAATGGGVANIIIDNFSIRAQ